MLEYKEMEKILIQLFLLLSSGWLIRRLFSKINLPSLLGFLILGSVSGPFVLNLIDPNLLQYSQDIRLLALIIILLRAGFGLRHDVLFKYSKTSLYMGSLPAIFEGLTIMLIAYIMLDFNLAQAGMLGFILAAVSPAVIVPSMLRLIEKNYQKVPTVILAGASLDDVFAMTLFSAFLSLYFGHHFSWISLIMIPISIIFAVTLGIFLAYILKLFIFKLDSTFASTLMISFCFILVKFSERLPFDIAIYLTIMTLAFVLNNSPSQIKKSLDTFWAYFEILLFVFVGALVNPQLAFSAGISGLIIILWGLCGRFVGVFIALYNSGFNQKEKLFSMLSYTPKATVQAAIGAIPLSMGVAQGDVILAIAVLSIFITAPIGAILVEKTYDKLLSKKI